MGDHLYLSRPRTITSTRFSNGFDPDADPVEPDRPGHARTLAGILAGIEGRVALTRTDSDAQDPEDRAEDDSPIVLVFEGRAQLKDGPFRKWGMTVLAEGDDNTYLVLSDREARRLFAELVSAYGGNESDWVEAESWRDQIDAIDGVHLYGPDERKDPGIDNLPFEGVETVDVLLWGSSLERPAQRKQAAKYRLSLVRDVVRDAATRDNHIRVVTFDDHPDSTLVRVTTNRELLAVLLAHPWVEKVRPPLRPTVSGEQLLTAAVPEEGPAPEGAPIGVIDDLITTAHPLLGSVVVEQKQFPAGMTLNPPSQHGTQVAGVAAYGDLRPYVSTTAALPKPHPVYGARIMHTDPRSVSGVAVADPLHAQLERALTWLASKGVKVAVCSINFPYPDERLLPSESAAVIDRLSRDLDMVVVVSAGNVDNVAPVHHWKHDYPDYLNTDSARVADPGTAALALTVGAVARYANPASAGTGGSVPIAQIDQPSPFTRVGPTRGRNRSGTRKPEFEAHGGNFSHDPNNGAVAGGDPSLGVITLSHDGLTSAFTAVDGTSFAAPYVAYQVAEIATRYPDASANLLRALTALSARPNSVIARMPIDAVVSAYGHPDASTVLESGPARVIVMFEGEMPIGSTVVHRIPVPAQFATGRRGQQLRVALAFDPPVRRTRRVYATGDMAFNIVRAMSEDDVVKLYSRQPTRAQAKADPNVQIMELPHDKRRPDMEPGASAVASNTLISRTMQGIWDPDDEDYYLVVQHHVRPWARKSELPESQTYAFAVELAMREQPGIDLLSLVRAQLRIPIRARQRG